MINDCVISEWLLSADIKTIIYKIIDKSIDIKEIQHGQLNEGAAICEYSGIHGSHGPVIIEQAVYD